MRLTISNQRPQFQIRPFGKLMLGAFFIFKNASKILRIKVSQDTWYQIDGSSCTVGQPCSLGTKWTVDTACYVIEVEHVTIKQLESNLIPV